MRKKAPVTTQCSNPQIRKAINNNNKSSGNNNNNKRSRTQRDPNSTGKKMLTETEEDQQCKSVFRTVHLPFLTENIRKRKERRRRRRSSQVQ
jgi:hypothetical protein